MTRKKTYGQARELAKQMANFFERPHAVHLTDEPDPQPRVVPADDVPAGAVGVEVFHPATARPNELDQRELSAVLAGLFLYTKAISTGISYRTIEHAQLTASRNGKQNPLTPQEVHELAERLQVTANKKN